MTTPQLPYTIKANSMYGYKAIYWHIGYGVLAIIYILMALFLAPEFSLFIYLLIPVSVVVLGLLAYARSGKSLTLTENSIIVKNKKNEYIIPFSELKEVQLGISYAGARSFIMVNVVADQFKAGSYHASTLNWNKKELLQFHAMVPEQFRKGSMKNLYEYTKM